MSIKTITQDNDLKENICIIYVNTYDNEKYNNSKDIMSIDIDKYSNSI